MAYSPALSDAMFTCLSPIGPAPSCGQEPSAITRRECLGHRQLPWSSGACMLLADGAAFIISMKEGEAGEKEMRHKGCSSQRGGKRIASHSPPGLWPRMTVERKWNQISLQLLVRTPQQPQIQPALELSLRLGCSVNVHD